MRMNLMTIKFTEKVFVIQNNALDNKELMDFPDYCPVCKHSIAPNYIVLYYKSDYTRELICGCPRNECLSLFIVIYNPVPSKSSNQTNTFDRSFRVYKYYPKSKSTISFEKEITDISPDFSKIYNQALYAEEEELDQICGVGYRKALEFLVKNYAVHINGEDKRQAIEKQPLQQCISNFISHPEIKEMATRAVWLGNDETHIVRKWVDKDIQDLKRLIDLIVHFINMEMLLAKYKKEMN